MWPILRHRHAGLRDSIVHGEAATGDEVGVVIGGTHQVAMELEAIHSKRAGSTAGSTPSPTPPEPG